MFFERTYLNRSLMLIVLLKLSHMSELIRASFLRVQRNETPYKSVDSGLVSFNIVIKYTNLSPHPLSFFYRFLFIPGSTAH